MRYPLRVDPVVLALPPADPAALAPAGRLEETVAAIDRGGGQLLDPRALEPSQRASLGVVLETLFGTPAAPRVESDPAIEGLDLSAGQLAAGSRVYRRLCNQCHGLAGDGQGPAGAWVYPHPRDFRSGVFKVAIGSEKPRVVALVRLIRHGVPASSMQPFDLIPDADLRAATAYTVHLSLRGEVEIRLLRLLLDEELTGATGDLLETARGELAQVIGLWRASQAPRPTPGSGPNDPVDPGAVRRGHTLFLGDAGCAKCHQDYGRIETFKYSAWGTPVRVPDLTRGEHRWGKEPADLAVRIRHGIPASGMPGSPFLTDAQVSDLVSFVLELAYPNRLPPDVRDAVYPPGPDGE